MDPKPTSTAKDFFVYLGTAVTLYFSAGSLLSLLFSIVDARFADPLDSAYGYYINGGATFAIASLIIVVPIFLFLSYYIRKDILHSPEKRDLTIRRWFVWFTLFVAGIAVAGDLVALLYTFLQGEVTIRFIFKVLAVLVISGGIFSYYFYDLRRDATSKPNKLFVVLAGLFVLLSIIFGFMTFGSPTAQRDMRFDAQREGDLSNIQWQVLNYWQTTQKLPVTLAETEDGFGAGLVQTDPETKAPYEYTVTSPLSFEICATFARASVTNPIIAVPIYNGLDANFKHDAGRTCFTRTIDPLKYLPTPVKVY